MGFKVNTSFLRFLTLGAVGVRATNDYLRSIGFEPLELERYSASNKIWMTKVKRLRLPDILCARTGLRFEVRAKSDLRVRMSDAPKNPDRRWDVGLRDDDIVALVPCSAHADAVSVLGPPVCFLVRDLRSSVGLTKLGQPKSASEGAERDREWKATVPSQDGRVIEIAEGKIVTELMSGRRQTYQLRGKHPYVSVGDGFIGKASIIAGDVAGLAPLAELSSRAWDPVPALRAADPVDRYAAAKAIPSRRRASNRARDALVVALRNESDERVALEMAGSSSCLGVEEGFEYLVRAAWSHVRADLRMEAVLILTELGTAASASELKKIAVSKSFLGEEVRQAAAWGLGKAGCRAYLELLDLIADPDDAVSLHAIAAFDTHARDDVVQALVSSLLGGDARLRAAASKALQLVDSEASIRHLVYAARTAAGHPGRPWIIATLGQLEPSAVQAGLAGDSLFQEVAPLLALAPANNWLASSETAADLRFLLQQNIVRAAALAEHLG